MTDQVRSELIGMIDDALGREPKRALIAARQLKAQVEWLTERSVALARREGFDWGRIPRLPPHVVDRNRYTAEQRETERLLRQFGQPKQRGQDDDPVAW